MFSGFATHLRSPKAEQCYYQLKLHILINENRRFILWWRIETACSSERLAIFLYWEHWYFQMKSSDEVFPTG